jgi:hypothetical protein
MKSRIHIVMVLAVAVATLSAPTVVSMNTQIPVAKFGSSAARRGRGVPIVAPHGIGPTCLPSQGCVRQ